MGTLVGTAASSRASCASCLRYALVFCFMEPTKCCTHEQTLNVARINLEAEPFVLASGLTGTFALHVRFHDAASQPISRVTFTLDDGTKISDAGTFSPGVTINHTLALESTTAASCSVTAVEFEDGSTWHAG